MGDANMGGAGASTPTRGATRAATGGNSPNAKRPGTIHPITTPDGPLLDQQQASKEIYALKRQFLAIENWANGVNAKLADHATHFDLHREKTEQRFRIRATGMVLQPAIARRSSSQKRKYVKTCDCRSSMYW